MKNTEKTISEKDIVNYKRMLYQHMKNVDDTFAEHSKRERDMASIAAKYGMSNHEFSCLPEVEKYMKSLLTRG